MPLIADQSLAIRKQHELICLEAVRKQRKYQCTIFYGFYNIRHVDVERMLVSTYKNNCKEIIFEDVQDKNDEDIIKYTMKYCNSFIHKPFLIIKTTDQDLQREVSKYNKK